MGKQHEQKHGNVKWQADWLGQSRENRAVKSRGFLQACGILGSLRETKVDENPGGKGETKENNC